MIPNTGKGNGEGVSLSPADYGVWGSVVSSPAGSGAEPRQRTSFGVFLNLKTHLIDTNLIIFDISAAYIHNR